jgi:hypothetical protein
MGGLFFSKMVVMPGLMVAPFGRSALQHAARLRQAARQHFSTRPVGRLSAYQQFGLRMRKPNC